MRILQAFVNRPIMATSLNILLLIIGLVTFLQLELRHVPNQNKNEFLIETHYPGANNYSVEQRITKPLEDSLSGLDGVRKINSESTDGRSEITVKFRSNISNKQALSELRDRVLMTTHQLPDIVKRPSIQEKSENMKPFLFIAFEDKSRSAGALSDYIRRMVEEKIKMIDGVSTIARWGDKLFEVSIELDPALLVEKQVTTSEVIAALKQEKSFAAGGEIEKVYGKEQVILNINAKDPQDFANVTIKSTAAGRLRIGDVATIKVTEKPTFLRMQVNGLDTVGLQISAKPQANPLVVAEKVKKHIEVMQKSMPPQMSATVIYDGSDAFKTSLKELQHTIWEAIFLVGLIVVIALASFRAAILPMLTVPLCLVATFAVMFLMGFSINPITLLALVLAVGLVVDDAIVVVENIHHHMESGLSALQAARKSMKEITFAIVVMTITLAAVYLPVAFQTDDTATMFREFAVTLAGSVLISGIVALTLTPALCGQFLKDSNKINYWERLTQKYQGFLEIALNNPKKICLFALFISWLGIYGFMHLNSEFMPIEDENFIQGSINSGNAVPEKVREGWIKQINSILETIPERVRISSIEWQQRWLGWSMVLTPRSERDRTATEIVNELKTKFKGVIGPNVYAQVGDEGGLSSQEALKVIVQHPGDYNQLIEAVNAIKQEGKKHPDFESLISDQVWQIPRLEVEVDKALAQELGVGMEAIEETLYTFLTGKKATEFNFQGLDYDVSVRAASEFRKELQGINQFFVTGGMGQWVPLGSLVTLKEVLMPARLKHFGRMRGVAISVFLKPGVSLDKGMAAIEPIVKKHLPRDAAFRFGGSAEKYQEARQAMWLTYGLSLLFIYLILAALFESFIHPLIVLITVPLSITGAVFAVKFFGGTNNIYTSIGLVTLVGLITKHGILIVDFSNRLRAKGESIRSAVLDASLRRLRPILMTTFAMIFGAIPLLFSVGAGALARQHIGWVIIGGMISGTLFSLFVIPVVYQLIVREKRLSRNYQVQTA